MRPMFTTALGAALALGAAITSAAAQSVDEEVAYVAISYTTVGGLPPLPPLMNAAKPKNSSGVTLLGRLGHMNRDGGLSLSSYGVGLEVPVQRWSIGGTLAYMSASCGPEWYGDSDCSGDIMLGGSARTTLMTRPLGENPPAAKGRGASRASNQGTLVVGFDGSAGYSPRQGEQAMAMAATVPTAIVLQSGDVRIAPFLSPGLAYGRLGHTMYYDDQVPTSHGTFTPVIGGGVGVQFRSGLGLLGSFYKVLKSEGGATQLGLGVTWNGLSAAR